MNPGAEIIFAILLYPVLAASGLWAIYSIGRAIFGKGGRGHVQDPDSIEWGWYEGGSE